MENQTTLSGNLLTQHQIDVLLKTLHKDSKFWVVLGIFYGELTKNRPVIRPQQIIKNSNLHKNTIFNNIRELEKAGAIKLKWHRQGYKNLEKAYIITEKGELLYEHFQTKSR